MEWETLNIETLTPEEEEAVSSVPDTLIKQEGTVLHRLGNINYQKGTVYQLVSNQWFVFEDVKVIDVADDLSRMESAYAVAVTDRERKLLGVIKRKEFFDLLGHPFGRDLLSRATIDSAMEKIPVFPITENIFTVADELETACLKQSESYYAIVDDLGKFCGMFSSKDLLIFLSAITKEEIELARKIQSRLIQEYAVYHWDRFEVVCSSQMAKAVGGDFYWVKSYDPYRYLVTLCDVSGKGMAASLVSSVLAGMLTTYNFTQGIKGFISLLNRFIYQSLAEEKFVTGVFIDIDIRTGSLRVFDMGHGLCHLYRNHRLHTLKTPVSNPPLGLQDDLNPRGFVLHLKPGDLLILHSDGLTEQRNSSGTEYSLTRVTRFIEEEGDVDLEKLNVQILEDFHQHRRMIPQGDDVTLLLLKWNAISS